MKINDNRLHNNESEYWNGPMWKRIKSDIEYVRMDGGTIIAVNETEN